MQWRVSVVGGRRSDKRISIFYCAVVGLLFVAGMAMGIFLEHSKLTDHVVHRLSTWRSYFAATEPQDSKRIAFEPLDTELNTLQIATIPLGPFHGGGAIVPIGNQILFIAAKGQIGVLRGDSKGINYSIRYLSSKVPMNFAQLKKSEFLNDANSNYEFYWFRTLGALLVESHGVDYLYVAHHRFKETCAEFVVSRVPILDTQGEISIDDDAWETVFAADPCIELHRGAGEFYEGQQSGGRLAKLSETALLVTLGDLEYDGYANQKKVSMDPSTYFGKAIELNIDTKEVHIFADGLRNPQGLYIADDGFIWETEHGPRGGDELNILERGKNYGWPEVSYGVPYDFPNHPWPPRGVAGRHEDFAKPVFAFVPSIGISNLTEVDGSEFPLWKGDVIVGSLKDESLWRLRVEDHHVVYDERIHLGEGIRDIHRLPNGEIAVLADRGELKLIRRKSAFDRAPVHEGDAIVVEGYGGMRKAFDVGVEKGERGKSDLLAGGGLFAARCARCHSLTQRMGVGPALGGVVGRKVGSLDYAYSQRLARDGGIWTRKRLLDFLSGPEADFKGTTMPRVVLQSRDCEEIIDYLETKSALPRS